MADVFSKDIDFDIHLIAGREVRQGGFGQRLTQGSPDIFLGWGEVE